jgi:DNA-directed RNA polymerase subunit RPC12/RpoP
MSTRTLGQCEICGNKANLWRCNEHYICDDCGTRESLCNYSEGILCHSCHEARVEKRIAAFNGDTDNTDEVVCPHCGYKFSDSWEMSEGEYECSDCGRKFEISIDTSITYSTSKI